jgi:adenylylsulfate kinase-like enzyme
VHIHIHVVGPAASGKSAIAQLIAASLEGYGIHVDIKDRDAARSGGRLVLALHAISSKTAVSIETKHLRRDAI